METTAVEQHGETFEAPSVTALGSEAETKTLMFLYSF